ncbi:MAG: cobyrinate a,c-diamide synthase [Pseudomonadota bacterium]|nr:cobyrinate a,c-diamide synthase [Pseudomonadota bacterium]
MTTTRQCPALFIAAPASGQGKTTLTAALARYHRDCGLRVRVFKVGPDFLDPMILEQASSQSVYQLDLWMGGERHCRQLLFDAAGAADLILIEGVMGLFDGEYSSADLAMLLEIPVLLVIDGSAMAQTFGALAHGLASYRPNLPVAGVFANRLAGRGHYQMLMDSLPPALGSLGWLPRDAAIAMPERHLGLVSGNEIPDLEARICKASTAIQALRDEPPAAVTFRRQKPDKPESILSGQTIAVARDTAFCFLYRANIELLEALGAQLHFFSPLTDTDLPRADALYLPGGYPELYMTELAANTSMHCAIRNHHRAGRPILAECGGMLYLLESLTDAQGKRVPMLGLLPGHGVLQTKLVNIGMHSLQLPGCGTLRGHSFHYSKLDCPLTPTAHSRPAKKYGTAEPVYQDGQLTASYLHLYFPANPLATTGLFYP